jgi:hypothetical protein
MQVVVCTKRGTHVAVHHYGLTKGGNHFFQINNWLDEYGTTKWNMCFPVREEGSLDAIYLGITTHTFYDMQCKILAASYDSLEVSFPLSHRGPHFIEDSQVIGVYVLNSKTFPVKTAGDPGVYTLGKTMVTVQVPIGIHIQGNDYWKYMPKATKDVLFAYHHISERHMNYYNGQAAPKK